MCWKQSNIDSNTSLGHWKDISVLELKNDSVTALAFDRKYYNEVKSEYILAVGLESGIIHIYGFNETEWIPYGTIEQR